MRPILLFAAILAASPLSAAELVNEEARLSLTIFTVCMVDNGREVLLNTETEPGLAYDATLPSCQKYYNILAGHMKETVDELVRSGQADETMRIPLLSGLADDMRQSVIRDMVIERGRLRAVKNGTIKEPPSGDMNRSF